jgi:bifunctional NMN adenylyltransferase/nudix hydrolase
MSLGVIVGRFQVDTLHEGHIELLHYATAIHDRILVCVGICPSPATATNPLPFATVEAMIRQHFMYATVIPVVDQADDAVWSQNLDTVIRSVASGQPVTIYSGRDGFSSHYSGNYKVELVDLGMDMVNATQIRERIGSIIEDSSLWRRGVIWAMQNLTPRTYESVDAALFRYSPNGNLQLLMGRKPNEKLLRLPGGFVETGETFAQAVGRECHEETGMYSQSGFGFIKDIMIDDWRLRRKKGVSQRTVLMAGWASTGEPQASDDLAEAKFVNFDFIATNYKREVVSEHLPLIEALITHIVDDGIKYKIAPIG